MKLSKVQLRKIIAEYTVKTVSPEKYAEYARNTGGLESEKPRSEETPKKRDVIGSFFMTKLKSVPRGYGALKKNRYFYMVLPDGEAIQIGSLIVTDTEGRQYLNMLNNTVTPLHISDHHNPTEQDKENIRIMQSAVLKVKSEYISMSTLQ